MVSGNGIAVIGSVPVIVDERNRVRDFIRLTAEDGRAAQFCHKADEVCVKCRDGHRPERERCPASVTTCADDFMGVEIEQDLDAGTIGDR